jgi:NAD-dependent deacetylase
MKEQDLNSLVNQAAELIVNAQKIIVFTGAGVSTESGIPDFRSPGGIWERFDPRDFTYQKFLTDSEGRKKMWRLHREGLMTDAKPNPAHYAIAELDKLGKLDCVITQNVDYLHQKAGIPDAKVFELHGNNKWIKCLSCGRRYDFDHIRVRLNAGEESPDCEVCRGILKPEIVFFGEPLPVEALHEASQRSRSSDLFIVIGSTLVVYPAAYMPMYAISSGAKLIIVNLSSTPMDQDAAVLIRARAGEAMPLIVQQVKERVGR